MVDNSAARAMDKKAKKEQLMKELENLESDLEINFKPDRPFLRLDHDCQDLLETLSAQKIIYTTEERVWYLAIQIPDEYFRKAMIHIRKWGQPNHKGIVTKGFQRGAKRVRQ